jgi:hypothetical protein
MSDIKNEFLNERFTAGLIAYHKGILSYGGFMSRIFRQGDHLLLPQLGWEGSREVLNELAQVVINDDTIDFSAFELKYPEIFEFYDPEAFGSNDLDV